MDASLIDSNINELSRMIGSERDAIKRGELMLYLNGMNIQKSIVDYLLNMNVSHNRRITDTEAKIGKHSDFVLQIRTVLKIFSAISTLLIACTMYGYTLIADLRDTVVKQSAILPRIEAAIERKETNVTIEPDTGRLKAIEDEINELKKLRVIRGSR